MRALVIVLDGAGVGGAPDAAKFNDEGANTLGHIFAHRDQFDLPALFSLGLDEILSGNVSKPGSGKAGASYGRMRESSADKDTITGHWEIAGLISKKPFAIFEKFPDSLIRAIEREAGVEFIGNIKGPGAEILEKLGAEHLQSGQPIIYTSADSVMHIAAHAEVMPNTRLYEICRIARKHGNAHNIARVIARPFTGKRGKFTRTPARHDYTMVPPRTVLNAISETGLGVESIGKISNLFARSGITRQHPTESNAEGMSAIERVWQQTRDGLIFAGLSEMDTLLGHERDIDAFARALMEFDAWLAGFIDQIEPEDLLIITADHGNDPTFPGAIHTREEVPVIVKYDDQAGPLGIRDSFADVAATLSAFFQLKMPWPAGRSFFKFPNRQH
jgi:phosphopentomutase